MADDGGREKVTIRALLQSVKYGLSPEQLWRDYIKMIGEECPYRKYGHNSFVDFLKAMPDVARFSTVRGQTVVVPVATAETKHIAKMVASQKCTAGSNVRNVQGKPPANTKPVPLDLQAKVKRLILPYPNGIPLHVLPSSFAKRYGYNIIPEKFGYMSMEEFVLHGMQMDVKRDATDNIQIVQLQDTASLSLAGFRPTVGRGRPHRDGTQEGRGGQPQGGWGGQPQGGRGGQPQGWWGGQPQGGWGGQPQGGRGGQPQGGRGGQPQGGRGGQPQGGRGGQPQGGWGGQPQGGWGGQPQGGWDGQPQGGRGGQFQGVWGPQSHGGRGGQSRGAWGGQPQGAEMPDKSRPFQGSAASQEEQLADKFSRKVSLNDIDRSPIGPPKPLPQQKSSKTTHSPSTSPKPVPKTFKGVLWRMLKQYPGGIPLPNFQEYYRRYAHEDLPVLGLGFSSVEQFVAAVPDVLVQHRADNGCVMLFAAPSSPTADKPLQPPIPEGGPKDEDEAPLSMSSFQKGPWPTKESVNVMVTHVVDPGHFYVQLIGKNNVEPLHTLQEDMTMFYSSSASSQHYYLTNVKNGQACVAVFPEDNSWYRAEIISVPDENRVSVRYVDYGNTATVPRLAVRRAKAHYFTLPVQALECTCAKIKPEGSQFWSTAATEYFRTMTEGKAIIAFVKKGQGQSGRLPLSLCDTSTEEDIFLSKELVQQGLAQLEGPQLTKKQQQPSATPPAPPQSTWPPLPSAPASGVTNTSHVSPPLPSAQVPYYMVHPQLWSAYMNHISMLQQGGGGGGLMAGPYLGVSGQVQQPCGMETYPVLTPTSDCMGVGMGLPENQANQNANLWLPSDDTELDTSSSARSYPNIDAAEEAVTTLVNERRKIIQSMNQLSDQSGTLSSTIDKLSALEAQIRESENKLQHLKAQRTGQGASSSTVSARPAHLDIRSTHPWQPATSLEVGRGKPLSPQVTAAPGGLGAPWAVSSASSTWQPQLADRLSHPPPPGQQSSTGTSGSVTRDFLADSQPSLLSSPASLPRQDAEVPWNKMGAPSSVSDSQKSANIGIGRGSSIRVLCAQAGLDWI